MFICGRKSSSHEDRDKNGSIINAYSTPKASKKSKIFSRFFIGKGSTNTKRRNPYSDRGLDKFYTLLADLDDEKQKIYSQMGAEDVCFVRFVNSDDDSKRLKAVVVKVKNKNNNLKLVHDNVLRACSPTAVRSDGEEMDDDDRSKGKGIALTPTTTEEKKEELMKNYRRWNRRLSRSRYYCFAVMIVWILLFLAIYGRSFAIFCTTISWYLIPRIVGGSSSEKKIK